MRTSPQGIADIKVFEALELEAYRDSAGVWTIGYGHTASAGEPYPQPGMTVTEDSALRLLIADIAEVAEKPINSYVIVELNQNQYDALSSLVFNIGGGNFHGSTLLRKLNQSDFEGAANEFPRWNRSGGQVLNGITKRRAKERDTFLRPMGVTKGSAATKAPAAVNNAVQAPDDKGYGMNLQTLMMLFSLVRTYGPKVAAIAQKFPDIEKTALDAIAKAKKLDIQGVQIDIQRLLSDLGLDESVLTQSLMAAQVLSPDAPNAKTK